MNKSIPLLCSLALLAGCAQNIGANDYATANVNQVNVTKMCKVISVRQVKVQNDDSTGATLGVIAGGVAGSQIGNGTVIGFKYFLFDGTESRLCVQVRGFAQGTLLVYDRERKGALLTKIDLHPDQSEWKDLSSPLCKTKGKRALFFKFRGKGKFDMNSFSVR